MPYHERMPVQSQNCRGGKYPCLAVSVQFKLPSLERRRYSPFPDGLTSYSRMLSSNNGHTRHVPVETRPSTPIVSPDVISSLHSNEEKLVLLLGCRPFRSRPFCRSSLSFLARRQTCILRCRPFCLRRDVRNRHSKSGLATSQNPTNTRAEQPGLTWPF